MGWRLDRCELEQVNTHTIKTHLCKKRGCAGVHDWRGDWISPCHSYGRKTAERWEVLSRTETFPRVEPTRLGLQDLKEAALAAAAQAVGGCGGRTEATVGPILERLCGINTWSKCDEKSLDRWHGCIGVINILETCSLLCGQEPVFKENSSKEEARGHSRLSGRCCRWPVSPPPCPLSFKGVGGCTAGGPEPAAEADPACACSRGCETLCTSCRLISLTWFSVQISPV